MCGGERGRQRRELDAGARFRQRGAARAQLYAALRRVGRGADARARQAQEQQSALADEVRRNGRARAKEGGRAASCARMGMGGGGGGGADGWLSESALGCASHKRREGQRGGQAGAARLRARARQRYKGTSAHKAQRRRWPHGAAPPSSRSSERLRARATQRPAQAARQCHARSRLKLAAARGAAAREEVQLRRVRAAAQRLRLRPRCGRERSALGRCAACARSAHTLATPHSSKAAADAPPGHRVAHDSIATTFNTTSQREARTAQRAELSRTLSPKKKRAGETHRGRHVLRCGCRVRQSAQRKLARRTRRRVVLVPARPQARVWRRCRCIRLCCVQPAAPSRLTVQQPHGETLPCSQRERAS